MNVLSLFDGMSCGMLALKRAGISVTKYYASEIDKYAIQVSKDNYPGIIQLGDINTFSSPMDSWLAPYSNEELSMWVIIDEPDLIIGGGPCQGFSFAGKQLAFDDPRSALFFKFVHILNRYKPKYFLFENVRMKKEYQDEISRLLGVEPICINSALVSAQNRVRYYWTNIPNVTQPADKGILLQNILEDGSELGARMVGRRINAEGKRDDYNRNIKTKQYIEPRFDGKSNCLSTVLKDCLVFTDRDKSYCLDANYYKGGDLNQYFNKCRRQVVFYPHNKGYRNLTPLECERLQTVPDNYTKAVSNTQRYKMLGNGWTVDVLAHIFKGLL